MQQRGPSTRDALLFLPLRSSAIVPGVKLAAERE